MNLKTFGGLLAGKLTNATIAEFNLGSGSTWPGHIALHLNPNFIQDFLQTKDLKIILVAGTNGKTTTTKILKHVLENNGMRVFQNEEGANLINGLATSLVRKSSMTGNVNYDVAIFEVDENNLPQVLSQINPTAIVFLNLFRDQLDRYGEVHTIASKWQKALKVISPNTKLILNADDPEIRYLLKSTKGKTLYFSIPDKYFSKKKITHDTDSTHCPQCGTKLAFSKIAYSHLGKYTCPQCKFTNENIKDKIDEYIPVVLAGTYNVYNIQAAVKTAREVFGISYEKIGKSLSSFTAAFGRQEKILYKKREIFMLLSKNPAGFNQSLSVVTKLSKKPVVMLALNDHIPDGRDVSWIWDVDFEELAKNARKIIITGDRAYDMGLRLKYSFQEENGSEFERRDRLQAKRTGVGKIENGNFNHKVQIEPNSKNAINELGEATPEGETAFILPTYSAMLELRKILTGKEIL